jgi:hypothetical protein
VLTMASNWSNFQSLIQLSITLNAAFAAFGSYAGTNIESEQIRLETVIHDLQIERKALPAISDSQLGGQGEVILVLGTCKDMSRNYEDFIHGRYRVISIVTGIVGIPFLVWSSYYSAEAIDPFWSILTILMYIPFFWGIIRLVTLEVNTYVYVYRARIGIERRLREI